MKYKFFRLFFLFAFFSVEGYAFFVENKDGVKIYYSFISDREVEVINRGKPYRGNVDIPQTITYGGKEFIVKQIGNNAFQGSTGLFHVTIPEGVTSIGELAFQNCTGLSSVAIPESVMNIGDYSFSGCSGLTSVTIPEGVTSINSSAFSGCTGLTSVTIPEGVTSIGTSAFSGCSGLTNVTIPESVTNIGDYAFSGCSSLTSVTIPSSVTSISSSAFSGCTGLTSVTIPSSVTSISSSAFSGCTGLTSVTIPSSVTNISSSAFSGCSGLTSVTIPSSVTSMGEYAFSNCSNLQNVTILEGSTNVGSRVFSSCSNLANVVIPSSVTSISNTAFYSCSKISKVFNFSKTPIPLEAETFSSRSTATLYVPAGCKYAYRNSDWSVFGETEEFATEENHIEELLYGSLKSEKIISVRGVQCPLSVEMVNHLTYTAVEFDLTLPEGVSIATDDNGHFMVNKSERASNHVLQVAKIADATYKVLLYSTSLDVITGNEGELINITLDLSDALSNGEYDLQFTNICLVQPDMVAFVPLDYTADLLINSYVLGDVNDDGFVNVGDIVSVANYILGTPKGVFIYDAANVVVDDHINVGDIVGIANIILHGSQSANGSPQHVSGHDILNSEIEPE